MLNPGSACEGLVRRVRAKLDFVDDDASLGAAQSASRRVSGCTDMWEVVELTASKY